MGDENEQTNQVSEKEQLMPDEEIMEDTKDGK